MFKLFSSGLPPFRRSVLRSNTVCSDVNPGCSGASCLRSLYNNRNEMYSTHGDYSVSQYHTKCEWTLSRSRFHSSVSQPTKSNYQQVTAHLVGLSIDMPGLESELTSLEARVSRQDGYILVDECSQIGHTTGSVFIAKNGSVVLWPNANSTYSAYKKIIEKHIMAPIKLPIGTTSSLTESIDIKEGKQSRIMKGILYLPQDSSAADKIAVSLALMSAVQLNHMELSIRMKLVLSNDVLARLRRSVSKGNLDRLAERLFEFQTYAHKTRYLLNLEHDPLEVPDVLWDDEKLCTLFMATLATFDVPQRVEKLNSRISWELDSLQSHSEYIRHKHSSRLEKIIILVITVELALGLGQALHKLL